MLVELALAHVLSGDATPVVPTPPVTVHHHIGHGFGGRFGGIGGFGNGFGNSVVFGGSSVLVPVDTSDVELQPVVVQQAPVVLVQQQPSFFGGIGNWFGGIGHRFGFRH